MPVVTSIAVRKGGTADLLRRTDEMAAQAPVEMEQNRWQPLTVAELRATQREADRIIAATISLPTRPDTWTARIDAVVLHPVAGLAILALILFVMFQAVFAWAQPVMDLLSSGFTALGQLIHDTLPAGLLQSFLQNGVISGVGSVIVFLPQIMIIFLFILLLEDFGYMARAAFLMDRIMGGAGLHGRAFIPLLSSFACAIPGIMATRVIDNRRDRLTTILIAPLMTCSARIPVYTLIISAFIPARLIWGWVNLQGLVMFGLYAAGIASALLVSFVIKFFMLRDYAPAPFMLELPDYKIPRAGSVAIGVYTRAKMFLQRAGTTIFSMMVLIWFLASFPLPPAAATDPPIDYSFAAMIGKGLAPLLAPIGFNWQIAVALIPGMAAREVAVAALGTVYAIEGGKEAAEQIGQVLTTKWSLATALSLLAWYIFAPQCASTLAVIRRETGSWKWMAITFAYMLALAYAASSRDLQHRLRPRCRVRPQAGSASACSRSSRHRRQGQQRKHQCGRHDQQADLEKLPRTDMFALAPQRDQPENGGERSRHRQVRTEIDADQDRPGDLGRHLGGLTGRRRDQPDRQIVDEVRCNRDDDPGDPGRDLR